MEIAGTVRFRRESRSLIYSANFAIIKPPHFWFDFPPVLVLSSPAAHPAE